MNLSYIIEETLLMAGFTFIVGIAFAYALKLTTFFFSRLNGHDLPVLLRKSRIWERAYRMNVAHTYRYIHSIARNDDPQKRTCACRHQYNIIPRNVIRTMQELAEYHFGNSGESSKEDGNMNGLYEFHHGKI